MFSKNIKHLEYKSYDDGLANIISEKLKLKNKWIKKKIFKLFFSDEGVTSVLI